MDNLRNAIKHSIRTLARTPGFTIVVILALAIGIGGNTAVFTVLNNVLLKPLPYRNPDKIVTVAGRFTGIGIPDDRNAISGPEFAELRRYSNAFSEVAAYTGANFNIRAGEVPERIVGATVSANLFKLLGVDAEIGRTFTPEEETPGRDTSVVIGDGLWRRRFGADPNIAGRTLEINGRPFTVAGVAPAGFDFPGQTEMWTPLALTPDQLGPNFRGGHFLSVLARIKPELSMAQALTDMDRVSQRMIEGAPEYPYKRFNFAVLIRPLLDDVVGDIRTPLLLLMGSVALVLLIACANVASLLLVRASQREREIGIRAALGASRQRLITQLLVESALLAFAGAAAGLVIAQTTVAAIARMGAQAFPRLAAAHLDATTLAFTVLAAVATGIGFGLVPALRVSQSAMHESLKDGGRGSTSGAGHQRLRRTLVIAEVALSLTLLSGAGLLIRSFMQLQNVDPGFRADGVLTLRVALPPAKYAQNEQIRVFFRDLLERISAIPGVESAGAVNGLPLTGQGGSGTTTADTTALPPDKISPEADRRIVTPGYLETMGTKLIAGRYFNAHDNETGAPVAIVDETMAKTYWPNEDAVGKRVKPGDPTSTNPWMTIVGVVRHVRYGSLERMSRVQVYWPQEQNPSRTMSVAIKTAIDTGAISTAVQRSIMNIDPDQPIFAIRPMNDILAESLLRRRLVMTLLAVFAGIALVLAALGIYGVVSYWVTQRAHEIGIRMALGASRGSVIKMVAGQSLSMVAVGVLIGLGASLATVRLIAGLLFNVSASDPLTFVLVAVMLLSVGLLASLIPAARAILVDPVHTLRRD